MGRGVVRFQEGFQDLVSAADERCVRRFGPRLRGTYVAGSVAAGEAWPGASDLDGFVFLKNEPTPADRAWSRRTRKRLERDFPIAAEVHLNVHSVGRLQREGFWRFILRYNAVQVRGKNLVAELERRGAPTPRPSRRLAQSRVPFVRKCLEEALAGRCPPALAELPSDPFLATRKLARNFVIVEGAFVLMCERAFRSFNQEVVLHGLRSHWRRWRGLTRTTQTILDDPFRAAVQPDDFMQRVHPFVSWAIDVIDSA